MKKRLLELDVLRGIAFVLVVIQHTLGGYSYSKKISLPDLLISRSIYVIGEPAVPIFLALTGMCLIYIYFDKFNIIQFYIKKIKYLVIPYILLSSLNILLLDKSKFENFIAQLLTGNSEYHLWYMALILRIYIFFPIILLIIKQIYKTNIFSKVFFFILYFIGYYFLLKNNGYVSNIVGTFLFKTPTRLQQKFINVDPIFWSLYFVIGVYIILNYDNFKMIVLKYKKSIFCIYFLVFCYHFYVKASDVLGSSMQYANLNIISSIIFNILSIIVFFIFSIYIKTNAQIISKFFTFIGKYSYPSYMLHVIVIQKVVLYIPQTKHIYSPIILLLITVFLTPLICYAINLIPYSEFLLGIKSNGKIPLIRKLPKVGIDNINNKDNVSKQLK